MGVFFLIDTSTQPPAITLEEPDVFTAFSVVIDGQTDQVVEHGALERLGAVADEGHVFVEQERVLSLAGERATDTAWREQLDGMIGYAQSKGWVDDAGRIRAHVERRV